MPQFQTTHVPIRLLQKVPTPVVSRLPRSAENGATRPRPHPKHPRPDKAHADARFCAHVLTRCRLKEILLLPSQGKTPERSLSV